MPQNLKARLGRIRDIGGTGTKGGSPPDAAPESSGHAPGVQSGHMPADVWPAWSEAGFKTLKRTFCRELPFPLPLSFPKALAILVPDFARAGRIPAPNELLFFDLETTGLSGGAGTVAFLAAFGRFAGPGELPSRIEITQYLLLDYPGESDFIETAIKEFAASAPPFVVSYNGKSFDSQILKTRCLMNGIMPPPYFHADLLHSARRLWKGELPDCSQATIEVSVLGLDRAGDVSGALAPDIWFSFLRQSGNGGNRELLSVCDHNARDITGLASIFLALAEITSDPIKSWNRFRFNGEALALYWWKAIKKSAFPFGDEEIKLAELLLENAAKNGSPNAAIAIAKTAEWQLGDPALALAYTVRALRESELPQRLREDLEKRRVRLEGKVAARGSRIAVAPCN